MDKPHTPDHRNNSTAEIRTILTDRWQSPNVCKLAVLKSRYWNHRQDSCQSPNCYPAAPRKSINLSFSLFCSIFWLVLKIADSTSCKPQPSIDSTLSLRSVAYYPRFLSPVWVEPLNNGYILYWEKGSCLLLKLFQRLTCNCMHPSIQRSSLLKGVVCGRLNKITLLCRHIQNQAKMERLMNFVGVAG